MPTLDIIKALNENEFQLFYQPQIDQERKIVAVEALIRWNHVKYGLMTPNLFFQFIKDIHTINEVNKWVTKTACDTLKRWESKTGIKEILISINITPFKNNSYDFFEDIFKIILQSKIDPHKLKIEITEQNSIADLQSTMEVMKKMQNIGVKFSLDDFGTGYSSFKHLQELPIQEIKIDKCFVDGVTFNNRNLSIVNSIIKIGNDLDLKIVAEGVEDLEQMNALMKLGCKFFQGYLFHKPMELDDLENLYLDDSSNLLNTKIICNEDDCEQCLKFGVEFWKNSSVSKIHDDLVKLFNQENLEKFYAQIESSSISKEYFIYYCWFFSDGSLLNRFINRKDIPISILIEIIFAGLSINESKMNPVDYFSFWSEKLSSEQSLRLLSNSNSYKSHPIFIACLLSNLDAKAWEEFFTTLVSEEKEIYNFLKLFEDFTIKERERMFALNNTLSKYFNLLITLISSCDEDQFLISLKKSIEKTLRWNEYTESMKDIFQIEKELMLPPNTRNSNRISCIINDCKDLKDDESSNFLSFLYQNSVIIDKQEFSLIEKLLEIQRSDMKELFQI